MIAYVRVVTPDQYQSWLKTQQQDITNANAQVSQLRQILTSQGNLGN
jgi:heme/copper-type cytochrome/quinol oxidase subunit 2